MVVGNRIGGFPLNPAQATFVSRLLQGLADGTPEVGEEELLKAAGANSMSELFPSERGGMPIKPNWSLLFIPGSQPNTWRMNVPEDAEPTSGTDAAAIQDVPPNDESQSD